MHTDSCSTIKNGASVEVPQRDCGGHLQEKRSYRKLIKSDFVPPHKVIVGKAGSHGKRTNQGHHYKLAIERQCMHSLETR